MSLRLYGHVAAQEVRRTLSYRFDLWSQAALTFLAEWALAWFVWRGAFDASGAERIGGFGFSEAVRYTLLVALLGRVVRGGTLADTGVASEIYDGTLSRYLVYPVSLYRYKYAQHVGSQLTALLQVLAFGVVWGAVEGPGAFRGVTPAGVAACALAVTLGNALSFALAWPLQGVAFWAENVWSLLVGLRLASGLLGGFLLPLSLFPPGWGEALAWLPFRYLYAFPVEALTGRLSGAALAQGLCALVGWLVLLRLLGEWVWRRGQRVYAGAGL